MGCSTNNNRKKVAENLKAIMGHEYQSVRGLIHAKSNLLCEKYLHYSVLLLGLTTLAIVSVSCLYFTRSK